MLDFANQYQPSCQGSHWVNKSSKVWNLAAFLSPLGNNRWLHCLSTSVAVSVRWSGMLGHKDSHHFSASTIWTGNLNIWKVAHCPPFLSQEMSSPVSSANWMSLQRPIQIVSSYASFLSNSENTWWSLKSLKKLIFMSMILTMLVFLAGQYTHSCKSRA